MQDPAKKLAQAKIDLAVQMLRLFAKRQSLVHSVSDVSLTDARRFAESLMLDSKGANVEELMKQDAVGARAFLALMDDEGLSRAYDSVVIDPRADPLVLPYVSLCAWMLDVICGRGGPTTQSGGDDTRSRR